MFRRNVKHFVLRESTIVGKRQFKSQKYFTYTEDKPLYYFDGCDDIQLLGAVPEFIGHKHSKAWPVNKDFLDWYKDSKYISVKPIADELKLERQSFSADFDTVLPILRQFGTKINKKVTAQEYLNVLYEEDFPWLKLPTIDFPKIEDLQRVQINPDAFSGYFTSKFYGHSKRVSASATLSVAQFVYQWLEKEYWHGQPLWSLGGRPKDVNLDKPDGTPIETRAVWMPEAWLSLLGLLCVQPLTLQLMRADLNCIFIGKAFNRSDVEHLKRLDFLHKTCANCDWSHFDANVTEDEIVAAMQIIRSCFKGDEKLIDRYFSLMIDTLATTRLICPPGLVFQFNRGLPSGHPFTSLCGTIINYMRFIYIFRKLVGKGRVASSFYALFSGDDTKFWISEGVDIRTIDYIVKTTADNFKCDPILPTLTFCGNKALGICDILKRDIFPNGVIGWNYKVLRKFVFPAKDISSLSRQEDWTWNLISQAPGNTTLYLMLKEYLEFRTRKENDSNSQEVIDAKVEVFNKVSDFFFELGITNHSLSDPEIEHVVNFVNPLRQVNYKRSGRVGMGRLVGGLEKLSSIRSSACFRALMCIFVNPSDVKRVVNASLLPSSVTYPDFGFNKHDIETVANFIGTRRYEFVASFMKLAFTNIWSRLFRKTYPDRPHMYRLYKRFMQVTKQNTFYIDKLSSINRWLGSEDYG